MNLSACDLKAKKIDGYMYMARRDRSDNESELCLLMLSHIQLMRFHHHENLNADKEEKPVVVPLKADTTDSVKPKVHRLGQLNHEVKPIKPTITRQ